MSLIDVSASSYPNTMTFGERGSNDKMTRQLFDFSDFFVAFSRVFQGRMVIMPEAGLQLAVGSPDLSWKCRSVSFRSVRELPSSWPRNDQCKHSRPSEAQPRGLTKE